MDSQQEIQLLRTEAINLYVFLQPSQHKTQDLAEANIGAILDHSRDHQKVWLQQT